MTLLSLRPSLSALSLRLSLRAPLAVVSLLLGFVPLTLLQVSGAVDEAQQSRMTPTASPQWSKASALTPFLLMLCFTPIQIATFILIIRRRRRYPIAGRGWIYLLVTCGVSAIDVFLLGVLALYFPVALPCPVYYLLVLSIVPVLVAYFVRSVILVCRLEVRNFLAERQWRIEKAVAINKLKEERQAAAAAAAAEEGGNKGSEATSIAVTVSSKDKNGNDVERLVSIPVSESEEEVDLSPESMQGYFFIKNRQMTHPRVILAFAFVTASYVVASLLAMVFLDPDARMQREWRESNGLAPDPHDDSSQFLDGHFLASPPCLSHSAKLDVVHAYYYCVIPGALWAVSRLWLNSKRQRTRSKERQDLQRRIEGTDSSAPYTVPPAFASDDLDDTLLVKNELFMCVLVAIAATAIPMFSESYGKEWIGLFMILEHIAYWFISIVLPLVRSEAISRRHRYAILKSRGSGGGAERDKDSAAAGGTKGRAYAGGAALPHQRPYFSTKFILHNAHTYPVLLKFLRKEYSSENALFYSEVRELKKLCVQLERSMPSWPQGRDEDLLSSHGSGSGGTGASGGAKASAVHPPLTSAIGHSRVILPSPTMAMVASAHPSPPLGPTAPVPSSSPLRGSLRVPSSRVAPLPAILSSGTSSLTSPTHGPANMSPLQQQLQPRKGSRGFSGEHRVPASPSMVASAARGVLAPPDFVEIAEITAADTVIRVIPEEPAAASVAMTVPAPVDHVAAAARLASLHADAQRAKEWCMRIFDEFLAKSAIFEINIQDDLSALVSSQIQQLKPYEPTPLDPATGAPRVELTTTEEPQPPPFALSLLFAGAQLEILKLLETDSFRRFILTAEFRALLVAADEAEVARRETQADLQGDMAAALNEASDALTQHPTSAAAAVAGVVSILSGSGGSGGGHHGSLAAVSMVAPPRARGISTSSQKKVQGAGAAAAVAQADMLPGSVDS